MTGYALAPVRPALAKRPIILAWDTETDRFAPGNMAPLIACHTWATKEGGGQAGLLGYEDGQRMMAAVLADPRVSIVGQFVSYDLACLAAERPDLFPLIWDALDTDRVTCTKIRQQLLDIAAGKFRGGANADGTYTKWGYSLDDLARRFLGIQLQKGTKKKNGESNDDSWRTAYGQFRHIPISQWVEHARIVRPDLVAEDVTRYAIDDAIHTLAVWDKQEEQATKPIGGVQFDWLSDQYNQVRGQFWLHLMSVRGIRTNPAKVEELEARTRLSLAEVERTLVQNGLLHWSKSKRGWSKNTKAAAARMVAVCKEAGLPLRRTKSYDKKKKTLDDFDPSDDLYVSLDEDACKASEDHLLQEYAEYTTLGKVLNNDVKMLLAGNYYPIHSRFDLVWTGRTSSSGPNIQNIRRLPGIRECFEPREGYVFLECDYPSIELYTLAEVCALRVGWSVLGEVLRAGRDPHTELACNILGIPLEQGYALRKVDKKSAEYKWFDQARQTAKVANFGFPGGLGIKTLIYFARKTYGVTLTEHEARTLKEVWFSTWTEMRPYFDWVKSLFWQTGVELDKCNIQQLHTGRWRGGCTFCNGCNTSFQGLASDIAKAAGWRITGECFGVRPDYDGRPSPLAGGRVVNFVHDQLFVEYPEYEDRSLIHRAAMRLGEVMRVEANRYLTTVPILVEKIEPTIIRYWSKDAAQVWENGELRVWPS